MCTHTKVECIGAYYGKSGRIIGAEIGAKRLKDYCIKHFDNMINGSNLEEESCEIDDVAIFNARLRDEVYGAMSRGHFPMIFGGDHSIAIGSISGVLMDEKVKTAVVYIDAHADMNTFETSPTGRIHGMPLAVCMGIGHPSLSSIVPLKLDSDSLLLIGPRSIDPGEAILISKQRIENIDSDYINGHSIEDIKSRLDSFISRKGIERIHVSFDIDVVDPEYAPATGVPEQNGINEEKVSKLLETVFSTGLVGSMDFVEYNPTLDIDERTCLLCERLLASIFGKEY